MEHSFKHLEGFLKHEVLGSNSGRSDSGVGTENEFPGDADAVGQGSALEEVLP